MALITLPEVSTIIGCAMRVHTALGPGLLESAYQECLAYEFDQSGLRFDRHRRLSLNYGTVDHLLPVHEAQVVTYLRLANLKKGLIINFRVAHLKDGLKSIILP